MLVSTYTLLRLLSLRVLRSSSEWHPFESAVNLRDVSHKRASG